MADYEDHNDADTDLELDLAAGDEPEESEGAEDEAPEEEEAAPVAPEAEEFAIEIEGDDAEADEPPLVAQLRREIRERDRKLAEMQKGSAPKIEVGEKPTLESCDYDDEKFEAELLAYHDRVRASKDAQAEAERQATQANERFNKAVATYRSEALRKGITNIEEAERVVAEALSPEMTGLIVQYSKNPDLIIAALHRHPAKLNAVAAEQDPVRRMRMLWELESKVKPVKRSAPPPPEAPTLQASSAPLSGSSDKVADKLMEKAMKTGDYSAYYKHMKAKRKAAA